MDFGFAIVEQLGHRRFVGRVAEETLAGAVMLKVEPVVSDEDVFSGELSYGPPIYLAGSSLFAVTPTSEEAMRKELEEASERRSAAREQRAEYERRYALPAGNPRDEEE